MSLAPGDATDSGASPGLPTMTAFAASGASATSVVSATAPAAAHAAVATQLMLLPLSGYSPQLHSRSRTTLWAELHSDEQNYTFDPSCRRFALSNWLQVALMSGLPIGIDQYPTDMPSPWPSP